ncbi:hypothetical protein ACF0H5_016600 [Mactra antiquata]
MKVFLFLALVVLGVSSFPEKRNTGCNTFCPMYIIEFCGSDGVTYHSNECFLKSQWCTEGRLGYEEFKTLHLGACTGNELTGTDTTTVQAN